MKRLNISSYKMLMSDQALTPEHLSALEGLLGHSIEDQPDQRFRAIRITVTVLDVFIP